MKIALIIIIVVVLILAVAACLYCYKEFRFAMDSRKEMKMEDLLPMMNIDKCRYYKDFIEKLPHEEVTMKSFDGLKLAGHFYPYSEDVPEEEPTGAYERYHVPVGNNDPGRIVIMCHGWRTAWWVDNTYHFHWVRAMGSDILLIDERCRGESEGRYLTFGINESRDILKWAALMHERFPEKPIFLFGTSLGAASVLQTLSADMPDYIKGIIADSGFTSPYELFAEIAQGKKHIPAHPGVDVMRLFAYIIAKVDLKCKPSTERISEKTEADKRAGRKFRILLVHGGDDKIVDFHMSEANYAAANGSDQVRYLFVPEAGHCLGYNKMKDEYEKLAAEVFNVNNS